MTSASTVGTHVLWVPYCRGREAATPSASCAVPGMATAHVQEGGREGDTGGVSAGPAARRIRGRVAPALGDPIVSSGAEQPRMEGGGVSPDVGLSWGQLVYTQGQRVVRRGLGVIVEPDLGLGDGTRPGSKRRQVLS